MRITIFFFSSIAFQNCVSLYDGHFVQTLTYVKYWRALNHKGNHESVKLLQMGTNNPKRGTLLLLHTLKWLLWQQGRKTDYLADDLVLNHQHLQCRPTYWEGIISAQFLFHILIYQAHHAQTCAVTNFDWKTIFFNDSNGYWNTIDSLVVFKQSNVKWEICRIL